MCVYYSFDLLDLRNINPTKAKRPVQYARVVLRILNLFCVTGECIAKIDLFCNLRRMGYDYYALAPCCELNAQNIYYLMLSFAVKIAVGSSANIIFGLYDSARASATRRCSPPKSLSTHRLISLSSSPICLNNSFAG